MLSLKERNDSWQNLLAGLGTTRDKSTYSYLRPNDFLAPSYLEQLYLNDDIAARICDIVPYEMLRQGLSITVNKEPFSWENITDILRDALVKSRIFGAAFIYVGAIDAQAQEKPLTLAKGVHFLNVLTTKELSHHSFYADANNNKYGRPESYRLNTISGHKTAIIHESRLVPFYGTPPLNNRQFPPSVLQRIYPVLQQFHTAWQATAHLMTDAAQGILSLRAYIVQWLPIAAKNF